MEKTMIEERVGSIGLIVAIRLFGVECVVDAGTWTTPATVIIPEDDHFDFKELEKEQITLYKAGKALQY